MTYEQFSALFAPTPRQKAGHSWLVLWPAHNDHEPSLWITPRKDENFIADSLPGRVQAKSGNSPTGVSLNKGLPGMDTEKLGKVPLGFSRGRTGKYDTAAA